MANLLTRLVGFFGARDKPALPTAGSGVAPDLPNERARPDSERGRRANPEDSLKYITRRMWVDPDLRATILDIRRMDLDDGRVKKIHGRMSAAAVKKGLMLKTSSENKDLIRIWKAFRQRLQLHRQEKLQSDARALAMEGNLFMQWVLGLDGQVLGGIRMPAETIVPLVNANGTFIDPAAAYEQYDLGSGTRLTTFGLWQLSAVRLRPNNFDDMGALGRPYLDASRSVWRKLTMTEEDLVIRRRERAPLRTAHVLEGASKGDMEEYRKQIEEDQTSITTNYYLNKKGGVTALQGDANLDQIADVVYLLDTFFSGSPAPKALFGYAAELNRDILEDLKKDYFDEIDSFQDTLSFVYRQGFELELLLAGINPDAYEFEINFAERRTDTPNQRADLALKYRALGVPNEIVWSEAGLDAAEVLAQRQAEIDSDDPYPEESAPGEKPERVKITPGNARKGESATSISNS